MPPKQVQHLPVLHPDMSHADTDAEGSSSASVVKQRRETRGIHSDKIRRLVEENGKIPVIFHKRDGRPIGEFASTFITELGLTVRKFAPLQVADWKKVTKEQKQPMFDRLSAAFMVDFSDGPESVKKEANNLMGDRFRGYRSQLHKHYKSLCNKPYEERLKCLPEDFSHSPADWKFLCALFESEDFQLKSRTNSKNRAKMAYNHCGGSRSFIQYSCSGVAGSKRKDRITLFNETHFSLSKNRWSGPRAKAAFEEMVRRRDDYLCSQKEIATGDESQTGDVSYTGNESHTINKEQIADRVCDEVLGRRSGYIRGLGKGPKPISSTTSDVSSRPTDTMLKNELESTKSKLQALQDEMSMMRQILKRLAPDAVELFAQQQSSSASSPPSL